MAAPPPTTVPLNVSAVATFPGGLGSAPIAVVQSVVLNNALSGAFVNPTAKGNCVVVAITAFNQISGDIPTVSGVTLGGKADNFFNAVTATTGYVASFYVMASFWVDYNCAGGQTAIAVSGTNLTVQSGQGITAYEIAGLTIANPLDKTAIGASLVPGSAWGAGPTLPTSVSNEIWLGNFTAQSTPTQPGPPWINAAPYSSAPLAGSGYQIVTASGTPIYAGSQSAPDTFAAVVMALKGATPLAGIAQIGPLNKRETWYPESISVSASSAVNQAACSIYAGPDTSQPNFIDSTTQGSSGFTTYPTASRIVRAGEYVFAVWTGGDVGAQGRLNIQGTKVIGSGGPPGWTHVRTRKLG